MVGLGPGFGGGGGGFGVSIDPPSPRPNPSSGPPLGSPSTLEPFIFLSSSPTPLFPEKVASGKLINTFNSLNQTWMRNMQTCALPGDALWLSLFKARRFPVQLQQIALLFLKISNYKSTLHQPFNFIKFWTLTPKGMLKRLEVKSLPLMSY